MAVPFAPNMTGNVSRIAIRMADAEPAPAMFFAGIVAPFIAGSFAGAAAVTLGQRFGRRGVYAGCLLARA